MKIMRTKNQDNINLRKFFQEITSVNVCC